MARKWWVLLFLVVAVAGGAVATWDIATRRMEAGLHSWAEARRQEGWRIGHTAPERTGFPLRPGLALGLMTLDTPAGFGWRAERAVLSLTPTDLRNLHVALIGEQALRLPGGTVPVRGTNLEGRLSLDGNEALLLGSEVHVGNSVLGTMALRVRGPQADFTADALRLGDLRNLRLDTARMVLRFNPVPRGSIREWRDGGVMLIEQLELRQGTVLAALTGGLALDTQLQPEGRGQLQLTSPADAVRLLSEAGLVSTQAAGPLRAFAGLGARTPREGGPPRLDVVLELRNRRLTAGRIPLGTLPEVEWR